jgi:hypothetical protein
MHASGKHSKAEQDYDFSIHIFFPPSELIRFNTNAPVKTQNIF